MRDRFGRPQPHIRVKFDLLSKDLFGASDGHACDNRHIILHCVHLVEEKSACVTANHYVAFDLNSLIILTIPASILCSRRLILQFCGTEWLKLIINCSACPPYASKHGRLLVYRRLLLFLRRIR